jgi:hypothetical protein
MIALKSLRRYSMRVDKDKLLEWLKGYRAMYQRYEDECYEKGHFSSGRSHHEKGLSFSLVINQIESGAFDIEALEMRGLTEKEREVYREGLKKVFKPTGRNLFKRCDLCPDDEETCYCYDDKPVKEVSP